MRTTIHYVVIKPGSGPDGTAIRDRARVRVYTALPRCYALLAVTPPPRNYCIGLFYLHYTPPPPPAGRSSRFAVLRSCTGTRVASVEDLIPDQTVPQSGITHACAYILPPEKEDAPQTVSPSEILPAASRCSSLSAVPCRI